MNKLKKRLIGICERAYEVILIIPIVFKVVRWDYTSLLIIMEHWIKRMKKCHQEDKWHLSAPRKVKELHICEILLNRLHRNEYADPFHEEHSKRWGKPDIYFVPDVNKQFFTIKDRRDAHLTVEQKKQEHKEFKWIMNHECLQFNQDLEYLFKMFRKHIRSWWT